VQAAEYLPDIICERPEMQTNQRVVAIKSNFGGLLGAGEKPNDRE
jgi:hypothetical protein